MNTRTARRHPVGALGRIGIVAGMHLALLLVIARGFGVPPLAQAPPDIEGTIIEKSSPDDPPPPPAQPTYERFDIDLVPPLDPIPTEASQEAAITPPQPTSSAAGESGSAVPMPVIVNVRHDPRYPLTQPAYPAAEIRAGNEGAVELEVYVLPDGRVGDARIARGSGFERMDRATLDEAKRRWRFLPATRDGEPFAQWHRLRVVFELRNP